MDQNKSDELEKGTKNNPVQIAMNNATPIVFTNQIVVLSATTEEIELGLCVKSSTNQPAQLTHRIITTTPHFLRMVDLFNNVKADVTKAISQTTK